MLSDGGVYDNLGLETAWKACRTVLVSDAGGQMAPEPDPDHDWGRHLFRVLGVIDNQVRSLRKRQCVVAFRNGERLGAYWGIRSEIADYDLADALPAPYEATFALATLSTRLARLDDVVQERLINWGYAACDAGMRAHVDPALPAPTGFPYPAAGIGGVRLELRQLAPWVFGLGQLRRYTQDSPVMPDVWIAFGRDPDERLDLLLEPHRDAGAAALALALQRRRLTAERPVMRLAYNQSHVAAALTFERARERRAAAVGLVAATTCGRAAPDVGALLRERRREIVAGLENPMREQGRRAVGDELPGALIWFVGIVGRIEWERRNPEARGARGRAAAGPHLRADRRHRRRAARRARTATTASRPQLWAVNRNRPARPAVWRSRVTVKADAATRLFSLSCRTLCWAVLDSGVDATHPAFARREADAPLAAGGARAAADSRVRATYDFTRLRALLAEEPADTPGAESVNEINARLLSGRPVDWDLLLPQLEIPHDAGYVAPAHEHGTHVAGILAGDWRQDDPRRPRPRHPGRLPRHRALRPARVRRRPAPATSSRSSPRCSTCAG